MASLHIQRTLFLLLQFSSLAFVSLGYNRPEKYYINCGSDRNVSKNGQLYVGDSFSGCPTARFVHSTTERIPSSVSVHSLYQTARFFRSPSSYEFSIDTNGTYLLRLHFSAFFSPSNSLPFQVSAPGFSHLQNFDAQSTSSVVVKEIFIYLTPGCYKITFTPLPSSFAFVNAIELFPLPLHFISGRVSSMSLSSYKGGLHSRALETMHRLNVGGQSVTRDHDSLLRNWIPDDVYLIHPGSAKNSSPYAGQLLYHVNDDSDGPNSNRYTAPNDVYGTAKVIKSTSSNVLNITWGLPVDTDADHLIRLHFCDYWSQQAGLRIFNLYIYDNLVRPVNYDTDVVNRLPAPYYYDFVVHSDQSGFMKISIAPNVSSPVPDAFLNGIEIMKVKESDNSKHSQLPLVLGLVLGGLVMVSIIILGFLWCLKSRKQKRVEKTHWLPTSTSEGSSHRRLTQLTNQSSHLSNMNLGMKAPLLDLQLATNDFHVNQIIGRGGFGNVYKGVLNNGMKVAVKRSKPGSSQGLAEFRTEIMVLSKIRHRNLVSLIGYCDETGEMILVYEYLEKGTLGDHLYNTNLPSLSWKQRLEVCIGAARGLHYLHTGFSGGIIHRDVKSTNILLDENYVAKVADFGLSKRGPLNLQSYVSTDVKGTFGYLDPEYVRLQKLTEKSDVYSFGVVLLEVLCARPVIDQSLPREQVNLADWGMLCKNKGTLQEIIDPSIKGQIDRNSFRKFTEIVEKCVQEIGSVRPTMGDVLWDLEHVLRLQLVAPNREQQVKSCSASIQLPCVRRLPSFSTQSEVANNKWKNYNTNSI
ncbi:hypothetical protein RJT34_24332 [Clitoria ternatea]|uniref:Protein kinase domain-containing protein n=1 Tax=Clitoria ternatea TaxID=43366 RepID=A0AAN9FTX6_CLITE